MSNQQIANVVLMWQQQTHVPRAVSIWYVSDLPGHVGLRPASCGAEKQSDWGFTTDIRKAIPLSPYWQRRFSTHCRRDYKRPWGTSPAQDYTAPLEA